MSEPNFDNSIRREEEVDLHQELISRLHQHGIRAYESELNDHMADLLSAIDEFEEVTKRAGADLFVDSADSSEPDHPELVLPHPLEGERIEDYTLRVKTSSELLRRDRM